MSKGLHVSNGPLLLSHNSGTLTARRQSAMQEVVAGMREWVYLEHVAGRVDVQSRP
jgi:hypothetical protein